jgi:hypothetical protein
MAGHYRLEPIKEPNIFSQAKIIGQTIYGQLGVNSFSPFDKNKILDKNIMRLSDDYKMLDEDDSVFEIGHFTLQEDWKEDKWLTENTKLEFHFDEWGNVNAIYIVL